MNDTEARPKRTLGVILLDAVLRLVAVIHSRPAPQPKVRAAGRRRGAGRYVLLAGVLAALAGTSLLVALLVRSPGDPAPPPGPAAALPVPPAQPTGPVTSAAPATPTSTATSSLAGAATVTAPTTQGSSPSRPGSAATGGTAPALTASYTTSSATVGLLGYQMKVTVANAGTAAKDGWVLTVTLPRPTLLVSEVSGATATQQGSVWTFTPAATTARVPAHGSVAVVFSVHGATLIDAAPQDCRIDGGRCDSPRSS